MCDAQKCWCRASRGDTPASDSLRPGDTTLGHSPRQAVKWKNTSLISSWGSEARILGGQTCARPLKKNPYSKIRWTSFHGSSAAISEIWLDTSLKWEISCLWRSLRDLARWISVRYLRPATSLVVTHRSLVSMLTCSHQALSYGIGLNSVCGHGDKGRILVACRGRGDSRHGLMQRQPTSCRMYLV